MGSSRDNEGTMMGPSSNDNANNDSFVLPVKKQRGSSTTTLEVSFSEFSEMSLLAALNASTNTCTTTSNTVVAKSVRFQDNSSLSSIHEYPQAAYNAKRRSDLFLSSQEQAKLIQQIRSKCATQQRQWPSGSDPDKLLQGIHDIPVRERVARMTKMPLEARGLEKMVCPQYHQRTNELVQRVVGTVMEHQYQQRESNQDVTHKMAQACREQSHTARCMARVLALADQQWVRDEQATKSEQEHETIMTFEDELMEQQHSGATAILLFDADEEFLESMQNPHPQKLASSLRSPLKLSKQVRQLGQSISKRVQKTKRSSRGKVQPTS